MTCALNVLDFQPVEAELGGARREPLRETRSGGDGAGARL